MNVTNCKNTDHGTDKVRKDKIFQDVPNEIKMILASIIMQDKNEMKYALWVIHSSHQSQTF